jgi:hypothetical protein
MERKILAISIKEHLSVFTRDNLDRKEKYCVRLHNIVLQIGRALDPPVSASS